MLNDVTMRAEDAIAAGCAECFVTLDGTRYNLFQMLDLEAKLEKNKTEVPILGRMTKGNKTTGLKGTFTGTMHYNTSLFREMMLKLKRTGEDFYFDMQITNEDPTSKAGRQTTILYGCNLDSMLVAKFGTGDEYLDESVEGTFEDWDLPESFNLLDGMQ